MKTIKFHEVMAYMVNHIDRNPAKTTSNQQAVLDQPENDEELQIKQHLIAVFDKGYVSGLGMAVNIVRDFDIDVEVSDEIYDKVISFLSGMEE